MKHEHDTQHELAHQKSDSSLRAFLPLIVIFSCVCAMTLLFHYFSGNPWHAEYLMRYFMASFFLVFSTFKMLNLRGFASAYSMYDLIALRWYVYGYVYPFIEFCLGVAYLAGWHLQLINWITLLLMLVSAAGVLRALWTGERLMCACLGTLFKIPMTYVTLVEDVIMAAMAGVMLYSA